MKSRDLAARSLGALLYCPASDETCAENIIQEVWPCLTSLALCLESSVSADMLDSAEKQLTRTLQTLKTAAPSRCPMLFVKVRDPEHLVHIHKLLGELEDMLMGYILPRFDLSSADRYFEIMDKINDKRKHTLYALPVLETEEIADMLTRKKALEKLKKKIDQHKNSVLGIRIGCTDLCTLYGVRRREEETVYDICVIRDVLTNLLNAFSRDYIISGPIWEYWGESEDQPWAIGLKKELEQDRINGFWGKSAVHPCQLKLIFDSMKVTQKDV